MSKKKQVEVVIKINDLTQLNNYLAPTYGKIVGIYSFTLVINIFDKFWGPCDVTNDMIKGFLDSGNAGTKVDFITLEKTIDKERFGNVKVNSKPKFFIFYKGNKLYEFDGIDFFLLTECIEKSYALFEEA